jgi:Domain of Unknown Function (DUF1080)
MKSISNFVSPQKTSQSSLSCAPLSKLILLSLTSVLNAQETKVLLDKQLSQFEIFSGVPHKSVVIPGYAPSTSEDGTKGTPIGLGKDPLGVFQVIEEDGQLVLHVSGQIYAGISTLEEYENYHFTCQYKWGEKKYEPRLKDIRDSGILIHCQGKHGAFWNVWMSSLECQVQEGDTTDFIPLAGPNADVSVAAELVNHKPVYQLGCPMFYNTQYTKHSPTVEKPIGEWNTVEIWTLGQTSVFAINGTPGMVIFHARRHDHATKVDVPLTKGKIQFQSEAAEIFYRDLKVTPIKAFPESLTKWVEKPAGEAKPFVKPENP